MSANKHLSMIFFIMILIIIYSIISISIVKASALNASSYEIYLNMDSPQTISSEVITITNILDNDESLDVSKANIYLERFKLCSENGGEIEAKYIQVETPFIKDNLERTHRFLIKKAENESGWFKIEISPEAVYSKPGSYTANLYIDELDWEIDFTLEISKFVSMELPQGEFKVEVDDPSKFPFFISSESYNFYLKCNHFDWRIDAYLEDDGLINEAGNLLKAEKVMYMFQDLDQEYDLKNINAENFKQFQEGESITILTGEDYERNLKSIRFALRIGESWSDQPAGLYKGTIVFTIINGVQDY